MAQNKSDNIQVNAPKNIDNKKGIFEGGSWRAFNDTAEAIATLPVPARYKTLEVPILLGGVPVTYWWRDGTADGDLVVKNPDIAGNIPIISATVVPTAFDGSVFVVTIPALGVAGKQIDFVCRSGSTLYKVSGSASDLNKTVTYNPSNGQITFETPFYTSEFVWAQYRNS